MGGVSHMSKMATPLENCTLEEQRAVVRFLKAEGVQVSEIYQRMKAQYGDSCLSRKSVYEWAARLSKGCVNLSDEQRPGRPREARTNQTIARVEELILADRRMTVDDIAAEVGISHGTAHNIIHDELKFRKVSCRWVPKMLTTDHKKARLEVCTQLLQRFKTEGDNFLSCIITGDETWVYQYEPESKRQSMEWKHTDSPVKKKFKVQWSVGKVMLTVFLDMNGPVLTSFQSHTVNSTTYCGLLDELHCCIKSRRRGLLSKGVLLQHDNATPHTAKKKRKTY